MTCLQTPLLQLSLLSVSSVLTTFAQSRNSMSADHPWRYQFVPLDGSPGTSTPAWAFSPLPSPANQTLGVTISPVSASRSSGYSPKLQTFSSASAAKNASSSSTSWPSLTSSSRTASVSTPSIASVRSVTVNVTVWGSTPPPRSAKPWRMNCV